jgi:acyl-CoA synthetase (AMP-forming)/AMP-acid ligase II
MDPSRPAKADPAKIVRAIQQHNATSTFGSPALWRNVAAYCLERKIQLPSLRRILVAGAPVPRQVIEQLHEVISPEADVFTPYGATEALPVASLAGRERQLRITDYELRSESAQSTIVNRQSKIDISQASSPSGAQPWKGTCVGFPFDEIDVTIIRISDDPIPEWDDDLLVEDGEVGEMVVTGPVVTKEYFQLPRANALSKIHEGETLWHRMGDLGYRDDDGRLWFCGRKAHRVETAHGPLFTECIEPLFNEHPEVARSALVGIGLPGDCRPVIIIEPRDERIPAAAHAKELSDSFLQHVRQVADRGWVKSHAATIDDRKSSIAKQLTWFLGCKPLVLFHQSLPVDVRHNAKINREALAAWAAQKLR